MRMDIEFSPGALGQRMSAAAREIDGPGFLQGGMNGKRLCSIGHPAALREERAGRFFGKRTMGVLWRHSSVNLVESRSIALAATRILRRLPKINEAVSITATPPQPAERHAGVGKVEINPAIRAMARIRQFRVNRCHVIQVPGFNDLADHDG
jgi:hypothetical protein